MRFPALGLCVVDEQQRFGVRQRDAMAAKGSSPDVLVTSATPIPRTLALALYGDLDVSRLDEVPPGRGAVRTEVRAEAMAGIPEADQEKLLDLLMTVRGNLARPGRKCSAVPAHDRHDGMPVGAK